MSDSSELIDIVVSEKDYDLDKVVNDFDKPTCCDTCKTICKWFAFILIGLILLASGCLGIYLELIKTKKCDNLVYNQRMDCNPIVIKSQTESTQFKSFAELKLGTYATCYSRSIGIPIWTANKIEQYKDNCDKREKYFKNNFNASVFHNDYTNSIYDRGHMTPAADLCYNKKITFDMINVVPQICTFNRRIWANFEKWIRDKYVGYVVVTTILQEWGNEKGRFIKLNNKQVYYPIGFCKIVLGDNNHVIWWGCIKQSEELTQFSELFETGNLHPPQYSCSYPVGD